MNHYIQRVHVNFFGGIFDQEITFTNGLNIISGENGTGKTRLLEYLKQNGTLAPNPSGLATSSQIKVIAFNPKRNSIRKTVESAFNEFRQQNRRIENVINDYVSRNVQDTNYENYPPFGELFAVYFEYLDRSGGNRRATVTKIRNEFNKLLKEMLADYEIIAVWDEVNGYPKASIKKKDVEITLNELSLGEQEILSLIFNLYVSRGESDIFLIDEPEVHLNWSLETTLFHFLKNFCRKYKKQIIVITHSRVIFTEDYYGMAQFLMWENGKIFVRKEIDEVTKGKLAGEAVSLTNIVKLEKKTYFVEDDSHEKVIVEIAKVLGKEVDIIKCGNKANVKSLLKLVSTNPEYNLAYFMIDSDNEGNPFPQEDKLIFLKRYCIECYLMNIPILASTLGTTKTRLAKSILDIIKSKKAEILNNYKYLGFIIDRLNISDIDDDLLAKFDCSKILNSLLNEYNTSFDNFLPRYIVSAKANRQLGKIFDKELIDSFNS